MGSWGRRNAEHGPSLKAVLSSKLVGMNSWAIIDMLTLIDFPGVRALSTRAKLQLMDELWKSVAPELDTLKVSKETKMLLDDRWSAFLKNPGSAMTLAQFKKRMRAIRR